jgi:hypothetical protein
MPLIIGVKERHPWSSRTRDASVPSHADTLMILSFGDQPSIRETTKEGRAFVARPIVNDDHFELAKRLAEDRPERTLKVRPLLVQGDDNGDARVGRERHR